MNQVFSFKRYLWLVKRQWYENAAIYTWGIVLMVLVTGLVFGITSDWKTIDNPKLGQIRPFSMIVVLPIIYGVFFFKSLNFTHKRMFYFSLPVSPLERIAEAFTYVMAFLPVLVLIVFTVCDFVSVQLFNHIHGTSVQMFFKTPSPFERIGLIFVLILGYLPYASLFMLCSLKYGKRGLIVASIAIVIFVIISTLIFIIILSDNSAGTVMIKGNFLSSIFFTPVCWVLMYFVMKKKEA